MLGLDSLSLATLGGLVLSAFVAGLARGFSGFGAALIFVPLASALSSPKFAPPLLTIVDGIFSAYLIPRAWREMNTREVLVMFAGAVLGIPLGGAILAGLPVLPLRWLITVMVAAMLLLLMSGWRFRSVPKVWMTTLVGAISGVFSGIAQIGGPPVVAYWFGTGTAPLVVRANVIAFFALGTVMSVMVYLWNGLIGWQLLQLALMIGPAYAIGTFLGTRLFSKASPEFFRKVCFALIACAIMISLPIHY